MFSTEAATTQTTTDETLGDIADDINEDNESGECVLLNVNGDCLDHLKYDKGNIFSEKLKELYFLRRQNC
jgi:hypothetical protein